MDELYICTGCDSITSSADDIPPGWIRITARYDRGLVDELFCSNECLFTFMHAYGFGTIA